MTAHSKIGASSMYRWTACPGSVRLSEGVANVSSKYAEEGTEAHEVAAQWLMTGGCVVVCDDEMREHVRTYIDWVKSRVRPTDTLHFEHQFDLSAVHPGCFGTADCVIWQPDTQHLVVADLKYGAGIPVEVEGNPQLDYYALGALVTCGYPAKTVEKVIVQPRCEHRDGPIRSVTVDSIDLLDFRADLIQYAKATEVPDAPLNPGSHCHFCPARGICPALKAQATAAARSEFGAGLPYDPAELKKALDSREVVKAWLKALDEFAYAEAEAGRTPPGYKLVAKRANRKWRAEGDVIDALQATVTADVLFEPRSLKSPAQLEKLVDKKILAPFIVAESSGHTLVPESDKRPPVKLDAKSEFLTATD